MRFYRPGSHITRFSIIGLYLCLLPLSCADDPPTSPEEVLRIYQAYLDQNQFEQAGALSTEAERRRLSELSLMIADDLEDTVFETWFESIQCTEQGDTTLCECRLRDQYEAYQETFRLIRQGGEWLVDVPIEEEVDYESEIEAIMDSLLREQIEEN